MFEFEQERKKGVSHPDPIFLDGIEKQNPGYTTNPHSLLGVHPINKKLSRNVFFQFPSLSLPIKKKLEVFDG